MRRFHASTYVVLLLTAAVLFLLNVPGQYTFHIKPLEPDTWRLIGGNAERIEHGWPWAYLVRADRYHEIPETGESRSTRIWSFAEDFVSFQPRNLVANFFIGGLLLAGALVAFEYWRRQRHHLWQLRVTDLFGITAIAAGALWYGLRSWEAFLRDVAASREALIPLQETGAPELVMCGTGLPNYARTRGGPSWLRELWDESFPPWWDRTVALSGWLPTLNLSDLSDLQVLSILNLHEWEVTKLAALEHLPNLRVLEVECMPGTPNVELMDLGDAEKFEQAVRAFESRADRAGYTILQHAGKAKRLERLALRNIPFGKESGKALATLTQVRILDLTDTALSDEDLRYMSRLPRLQDLTLDQTNVTDAGLGHLARSKVRRLSLRGCNLSAACLQQLARIRTLEQLNLSRSRVDPVNLEQLASLPRLQRLCLPGGIDPAAVAHLKHGNPKLQIDYDAFVDGGLILEYSIEAPDDPFAP